METEEKTKKVQEVINNIRITQKELDTVLHRLKECELALSTLTNKMSFYNLEYQSLLNNS